MVVLAQFTASSFFLPSTGDLNPQGVEENTQTDKAQDHGPGHETEMRKHHQTNFDSEVG